MRVQPEKLCDRPPDSGFLHVDTVLRDEDGRQLQKIRKVRHNPLHAERTQPPAFPTGAIESFGRLFKCTVVAALEAMKLKCPLAPEDVDFATLKIT